MYVDGGQINTYKNLMGKQLRDRRNGDLRKTHCEDGRWMGPNQDRVQ